MPIDPGLIGPTTLAVTQAVNAFTTYLPPLTEVRKKSTEDAEFAADVRMGEVASCALAIGVGLIASSLTGSPWPAIVGAVASVGLVMMYESVLRADRPMEATNA